MTTIIPCGPCRFEGTMHNAKKWCTNCEEGFCEDCEKVHRSTKMTKDHKMISILDYQTIKYVSVNQTCVDHDKRYDLYCPIHDKPLCIECIDSHKVCSRLVSLDKVSANSKQSIAFVDLDDTIKVALENVKKYITDQISNSEEIEAQENLIKKKILEIREKLDRHLDHIEQKLIQNLSNTICHCNAENSKVLNQLNNANRNLSQYKGEMETLAQMGSDEQIFLATREIDKTVSGEIETIKSIINNRKCFEINIEIDSTVTSIFNCFNQLGIISVLERKSELEFKDAKLDHAQKQVVVSKEKQVSDSEGSDSRLLDLQLKLEFKICCLELSGCLLLPNGFILIPCYLLKQITECNEHGQHSRYISCSSTPIYLTLMDPARIAVTYRNSCDIEIINLKKGKVQNIRFSGKCRGISYHDGKMYVIVDGEGIVVSNRSGKIFKTLAIDTTNVFEIATSKDGIYYTNGRKNTIHCLSLTGKEKWVYQDESIICPRDLTAVNDQGVLVVGRESNNLSIIKQNGLESEILLRETDGLIKPRAVYYSKNRKELLVCSEENWSCAVYKVIVK